MSRCGSRSTPTPRGRRASGSCSWYCASVCFHSQRGRDGDGFHDVPAQARGGRAVLSRVPWRDHRGGPRVREQHAPLSGRWQQRQRAVNRGRRQATSKRLAQLLAGLKALERWNATAHDDGHTDHLAFGPDREGPDYLVDDVTRLVREAEKPKTRRP